MAHRKDTISNISYSKSSRKPSKRNYQPKAKPEKEKKRTENGGRKHKPPKIAAFPETFPKTKIPSHLTDDGGCDPWPGEQWGQ